MSTFTLLSILVSLAALFGIVSRLVLRLPTTVGMMALSLCFSGVLLVFGGGGVRAWAVNLVGHIDFNVVVLHGMLGLLLFAGSLHLDLDELRRQKLPVLLLSVVSTAAATLLVGAGLHGLLGLTGMPAPWLICLLFGALISPTDPVAVLEMLGRVRTPAALQSQLAGESLLNDGVGAVLFLALLGASAGGALPSAGHFLWMLAVEAGGGIALGLALSFATYRLLRTVDDCRVEVLLTLALAMGGYALADRLGLSMPLEAVAAGLFINGHGRRFGMSPVTRRNVDQFWSLIDDILNAILFLLIGLEVLVVPLPGRVLALGCAVIVLVLLARMASVALVVLPLRWLRLRCESSLLVLTWGGLRGGLSVALALSLPRGAERSLLLSLTYLVVVASILGQGMTVGRLLRRQAVAEPVAVG